ncbi:MAG TPA: hypothetical protein VN328_08385 [Thermodesulfovibrionales bacterium]|nr:hypothetical protein [Thermodesulfovibrionales bacterium]
MKDEEIRLNILRILYAFYRDNPLSFLKAEVVINEIGREEKGILSQLNYLLDAGYLEGKRFKTFEGHGYLEKVKITAKGINVIEPPSKLDGQTQNIQTSIMIESLLMNVIEEIESANISAEEKKGLLEEVNKFLTNPYIAPFVGAALLKLAGSG